MFGIHFKHSLLKSGILRGGTDIHCHVLPGVDDGSPDEGHSLELLSFMQEVMGFRRICLTPHVMQGMGNDAAKLQQRFDAFCKIYEEQKEEGSLVGMHLSSEYMLDAGFAERLHTDPLPIGKHLLVETSYMSAPMGGLDDLLLDVWNTGFVPIIAHPERYMYMEDADYQRLHGMGYAFQLNLLSLSGYYGGRPRVVAERLLKMGLYDFVGSDLHHVERFEDFLKKMKASREQLDALSLLFENNDQLLS